MWKIQYKDDLLERDIEDDGKLRTLYNSPFVVASKSEVVNLNLYSFTTLQMSRLKEKYYDKHTLNFIIGCTEVTVEGGLEYYCFYAAFCDWRGSCFKEENIHRIMFLPKPKTEKEVIKLDEMLAPLQDNLAQLTYFGLLNGDPFLDLDQVKINVINFSTSYKTLPNLFNSVSPGSLTPLTNHENVLIPNAEELIYLVLLKNLLVILRNLYSEGDKLKILEFLKYSSQVSELAEEQKFSPVDFETEETLSNIKYDGALVDLRGILRECSSIETDLVDCIENLGDFCGIITCNSLNLKDLRFAKELATKISECYQKYVSFIDPSMNLAGAYELVDIVDMFYYFGPNRRTTLASLSEGEIKRIKTRYVLKNNRNIIQSLSKADVVFHNFVDTIEMLNFQNIELNYVSEDEFDCTLDYDSTDESLDYDNGEENEIERKERHFVTLLNEEELLPFNGLTAEIEQTDSQLKLKHKDDKKIGVNILENELLKSRGLSNLKNLGQNTDTSGINEAVAGKSH